MKRVNLKRIVRAAFVAGLVAVPCIAAADPVTLAAFAINAAYAAGYITVTAYIAATAAVLVVGTITARRQAASAMARQRAQYVASLTDRTQTVMRTDPPWRVVAGRAMVGGDIIAVFTSDKTGTRSDGSPYTRPDALRHMVIHVATHQVHAIHDVYLDGVAVGTLDASGWSRAPNWTLTTQEARDRQIGIGASITEPTPITVVSAYAGNSTADASGGMVTGSYALSNGNRTITNTEPGQAIQVQYTLSVTRQSVRLSRYLGTTTQTADPYLTSVVPAQWGATDNLPGIAYVVLTLDLEDPRFQSGNLDIAFDVSGMLCLDPRDGQTRWTANPALIARQFLREEWGYGCAADEIDDAYTIAAANACDQIVSVGGNPNGLRRSEAFGLSPWSTFNASVQADVLDAPPGYSATWIGAADRLVENTANSAHAVIQAHTITAGSTNCLAVVARRSVGARNVALEMRNAANALGFTAVFDLDIGSVLIEQSTGSGVIVGSGIRPLGDGWHLCWVSGRVDGAGTTAVQSVIYMAEGSNTGYVGNGSNAIGLFAAQTNPGEVRADYVRTNATGAEQARYTCHGGWTTQESREAVLAEIATSMAGEVVPSAQWLIIAGAWSAPVMDLTDDDLDGQIEVIQNGVGVGELINTVRGQYLPFGGRAPRDYVPYSNATYLATDGRALGTDRTYQYVNGAHRCHQLGRIEVERVREGQMLSYPAKLRAVGLRIGDRVRVTSAEYGLSLKEYRVEDYSFGLQSAVVLMLREDGAAVWDLADATTPRQLAPSNLPSPWQVQAVAGVTAASGTAQLQRQGDGSIVTRVLVSWTAVTDAYLQGGQGRIRIRWRRVLRDAANTWQVVEVPADETRAYLLGAIESDALLIGVSAVNNLDVQGPESWIGHVVVGKSEAPSFVAGLAATPVQTGLRITWTPPTDLDYETTELRRGANWGAGVRLDTGGSGSLEVSGSSFDWLSLSPGSYTILARHRDSSGNLSTSTASLSVTVNASDIGIGSSTLIAGTAASTVVSNASTAVTNAAQALVDAAAANAAIANIVSDNVLSRPEKPQVIVEVQRAQDEYPGIVSLGTARMIGSELTAYTSAYSTLTTYLGTLTSPVAWNNTTGDTTIVGTTFRSNFAAYYAARQALLNRIEAAQVAGQNMTRNSSFEVDSDANGLSDNWNAYSSGTTGGVTYSRLNSGGRRGSFYQRITAAGLGSTTNDRAGLFQDHSVDGFGGRSGWWSIWAFANLGNGWRPRLFVEFLDASNATVGAWDTGELPTPAANAWIRHTVSGTIPATAVLARAFYWIQRNAAAALSVVSLDDALFTVGEILPEWTNRGDELLPGVVTTPILADQAATGPATEKSYVNAAGLLISGPTDIDTMAMTVATPCRLELTLTGEGINIYPDAGNRLSWRYRIDGGAWVALAAVPDGETSRRSVTLRRVIDPAPAGAYEFVYEATRTFPTPQPRVYFGQMLALEVRK